MLMILLDYRDKRPLYEQVIEKMIQLIAGGGLSPGDKLPSVRSLAMDLSVNPNTIQRAYNALEADGYIYTVTGRGNYVADPDAWKQDHESALEKQLTEAVLQVRRGGLTKEQALLCVEKAFLMEES